MERNNLPGWFRVIEANKKRPSLLFVIGALRESGALASDGEDFEQFYGLLRDMASYYITKSGGSYGCDRVVYVRICPDLRVPVLSIWNEELTRSCRARYPSPEHG